MFANPPHKATLSDAVPKADAHASPEVVWRTKANGRSP